MTRRRLVALVSAVVLGMIGLVILITGLFVTQTARGRNELRGLIQPLIARQIRGGSLYIGHLGGSLISGVTIDSIAIRDKRGDLFLSTGPVTLEYNWRDLIDNRIYIRKAHVEHPYVHLVQHADGEWNFKEIFASNNAPSAPKNPKTRNLGDYIVIDSTSARNGTFLLTLPWHAEDTLRGAVRDSVIRANLTDPAKAVTKTFDGYGRTYAWRNGMALIPHVRLADPDSDKFGQTFQVASLSVDEYEPTFKFRNVRADVRHLGDSVWFQSPHFSMPASFGSGHGKVWWGSDLPVRYDIAIRGDSVSLDDVNWVYPDLPRTGGGTLNLAIKNDPKNLRIVDFKLSNMDVRSTRSHVTGAMSFGIGAPVLLVRNVDLRGDPVDFDLFRTLNGKPFPIDWQGQVFGTVKGRGGPLTHFFVDDAQATFEDAHVRGAVSRVAGRGEVDILRPAFTAFHGFNVNASSVDLRSIEYLFPSFPRLGGFVSGTATLDSSWLDVRFSNAHVVHQDGPGEPSQLTGSGRITDAEKYMIYDVTLDAEPLSLATLSRSYPMLPRHGLLSGPIRAKGSAPDLELTTSLQGDVGSISYDGHVDLDSLSATGYAAQGHGQFSNVDLAALFTKPGIPRGAVSGHYDVDVSGKTAATVRGSASVGIERTTLDSIRVYPSQASVSFADGRMTVDSLRVHTTAATITATGGIGLPKGHPDSLRFTVNVDSLGGLRPYLSHPDTTLLGAAATPADSLSGSARLTGVASGTLDALDLSGLLSGNNIYINKDRGEELTARFDFHDVFRAPNGSLQLRVDTVTLAGVALDTIGGVLRFSDANHAQFQTAALSRNGPTADAGGTWSMASGARTVVLDSLGFVIGDDRWRLAGPAHFAFDSTARRLDSLVVRNRDAATIAVRADVPNTGPAFARLQASRIPLRDVGILTQLADTLSGIGDVSISAGGTKAQPQITGTATLSSMNWSGLDVDRVSATADYRANRAAATLDVVRKGETAVSARANVPVDITLFGIKARNDSISGSLRADTTDLAILDPLFQKSRLKLSGRLAANVTASGTMRAPVFNGTLAIRNGAADVPALGITLTAIDGRVDGGLNAMRQDSINVQLAARTSRKDSVSLSGWVRNLAQTKGAKTAFSLQLTADSLHAFNKRSIADLYVSTAAVDRNGVRRLVPLELEGTVAQPVLSGSVLVDRGSIYLADRDLARKQTVAFITDSTGRSIGLASSLGTSLMANLVISNVPVTLGQDVRLKSAEADVRLAGQLNLVTSTDRSTRVTSSGQLVPGLALEGQLTTVSGSYNLNVGLVQREFTVLPNGTVTFDGPVETPLVDIKAQYNVKQYRDRDVGVIVNLTGRMPSPKIEFSSNIGYELSQSDLLSYLIIGRPGFDFGANPGAAQVVSSFLAPTLSAVAADRLRQTLPGLSAFTFELGTASTTQQNAGFFNPNTLSQYLSGATIGAQKQVTSNLYVGAKTTLCQLQTSRPALGATVEYQFTPKFSLQGGYDPATNTCYGGQQQIIIGTVPTPPNWSLSLRQVLRF